MIFRWFYIAWKITSRTLFLLVTLVLITFAATFGVLQLTFAKNYISSVVEAEFNKQYEGTLSIGKLDGMIPYRFKLDDVYLTGDTDTIVYVKSVALSIRPWDLIRNKIIINSLELLEPDVAFTTSKQTGKYTIFDALNRRQLSDLDALQPLKKTQFEVLAPFVGIENGHIIVDKIQNLPPNVYLPEPFILESINFSAFVEINEDQRFLDVQFLIFSLIDAVKLDLVISGQFYNDNRFVELNSVQINTGKSFVNLNFDTANLNLMDQNWTKQIKNSFITLKIDSSAFYGYELAPYINGLPPLTEPLHLKTNFQGTINTFSISDFSALYKNSFLRAAGEVTDLSLTDILNYDLEIMELYLVEDHLGDIRPNKYMIPVTGWNNATITGRVSGKMDESDVAITMKSDIGNIGITGAVNWLFQPEYMFQIDFSDIDIIKLTDINQFNTNLNGSMSLTGNALSLYEGNADLNILFQNSRIGDLEVPYLSISTLFTNGIFEPFIEFNSGTSRITGNGFIDISSNEKKFQLQGFTQNMNLQRLFGQGIFDETQINMQYAMELLATDVSKLHGFASFDITSATAGGVELEPHQLYFDLNPPGSNQRNLRFTSTIMDLNLSGTFDFDNSFEIADYWIHWITESVRDEIALVEDISHSDDEFPEFDETLVLNADLNIKNTDLLTAYIPALATLKAMGNIELFLNADKHRMLITGEMVSELLNFGTLISSGSDLKFTANFRSNQLLRDFSGLNILANSNRLSFRQVDLDNYKLSISMLNDSISIRQNVDVTKQDFKLDSHFSVIYGDTIISLSIEEFSAGNQAYRWMSGKRATFQYDNKHSVSVRDLYLTNNEQIISIDGKFSPSQADSVVYLLNNLKLEEISGLIGGRVKFSGKMNGVFSTKSIFTEPAITGFLFADGFAIDNRIVGDIEFLSNYNPVLDRFDMRLNIQTPPEKYATELMRRDVYGTNISIDGYLYTPDSGVKKDTLYFFNVNMPEIDLWLVDYIVPELFQQLSGRAEGRGYFMGDFDDVDFNADFTVIESLLIPEFLLTRYRLDGRVILDKHQGLMFDNLNIRDDKSGSGKLYGSIDLNDFKPEKTLNLNLEMNQLEFLNNQYMPDIAFYGNVAATGVLNLSGLNVAPFLRTVGSINTTSNSRLAIPLLDETSVEEQARFIEFVNDFSEIDRVRTQEQVANVTTNRERRFIEIFTLDLSFNAPANSTVQLVFDPLTNEILNARGSGRVRITLEDENIQVFGNFSISEGDYTFVAGDVFTRRFLLRSGGTISWDGNPDNARLNIPAAYRSRPDIAVLSTTIATTSIATRIPVDLILVISGTLDAIENDFYFEFPNAVDVSQNATDLALLNSEEQKLIQATSLLFTGGFLPVGNLAEGQGAELGASLQQRAGAVGLSQLLSSQINALLNSSLSILDIDLNLTGFNQADLGVALRLFDDRLVIRGESQLSQGNETMIGDLGATYRISRALSIEIFHRRDPTLRGIVGNQTQVESINGVGLEAQVQFNTWKELRHRFVGSVKRLFTFKNRKEIS